MQTYCLDPSQGLVLAESQKCFERSKGSSGRLWEKFLDLTKQHSKRRKANRTLLEDIPRTMKGTIALARRVLSSNAR